MDEAQWENQLRLAQAAAYSNGYASALEKVREAVAGISVRHWPYDESNDEYAECIPVDAALAAIDALATERQVSG